MERQFMKIENNSFTSEKDAFPFVLACFASLGTRYARLFAFRQSYPRKRGLALHFGFGFDLRPQGRYARRNAKASGHPPHFLQSELFRKFKPATSN